jgi:hypothetical protein
MSIGLRGGLSNRKYKDPVAETKKNQVVNKQKNMAKSVSRGADVSQENGKRPQAEQSQVPIY